LPRPAPGVVEAAAYESRWPARMPAPPPLALEAGRINALTFSSGQNGESITCGCCQRSFG